MPVVPTWDAEILVNEELAAKLVREQFAPLPDRSVELLSEGWDYVVHRVDDEWAFRFPRRAVVVPGTELEISVLPRLALPVAVPAPTHIGRPTERFPWPFYGARFIPGSEPLGLTDDERAVLARPLGRALRALHATEILELPVDPIGRADMRVRIPRTRDALLAVDALTREAEWILAEAARLPPVRATAVVHGDLHFRQLLVDDGALTGVIDWVDVCRSDPGVDLQLLWSFFPRSARDEFFDEYGPVSGESLLRARVLALFLSAVLLAYARDAGNAAVAEEASAGLTRTLAQ